MKQLLVFFVAAHVALLAGAVYFQGETRINMELSATQDQFPFMALIRLTHNNGQMVTCSGTLISDTWVLIAAHCLVNTHSMEVLIRLVDNGPGSYSDQFLYYKTIPKDKIHVHPEWNPKTFANDIALVQLPAKAPVDKFKRVVSTVTLSTDVPVETYDSKWATSVDWGKIVNKTSTLKYSRVKIMKHRFCQKFIERHLPPNSHFGDDTICGGKLIEREDCPGDSSGPLVNIENEKHLLIGIATVVTKNICFNPLPILYTHIGWYHEWIERSTRHWWT